MIRICVLCLALECLLMPAACLPAAASGYAISDLGLFTMSGIYSIGNMNGRGQVVGTTYSAGVERGFVYVPGLGSSEINPLAGHYSCRAITINESGQVLGVSIGSSDYCQFMYTPSLGTSIVEVPGAGRDMNDAGQISGADGSNHGFIYTPGSDTIDLGAGATGYAISESGWAVAGWHSIFVPGTGVVDLGFNLNGYMMPTGINDLGQIVFVDGRHSFVYDWRSGVVNPLDTPGYDHITAYDIDNAGNITGLAKDVGGAIHILAWTPVPEPSSVLAVLVGLSGLFAIRRRQKD